MRFNTAVSVTRRAALARGEPDPWPTTPAGMGADSHAARMRHHFGLLPRRNRWLRYRPCPRTLVGKRCQLRRDRDCLCSRHYDILDHGRGWRDRRGQLVHTAEPFHTDADALAALAADLRPLGVRIDVSGQSLYYPGHAILLMLRPDGDGVTP